MATGTIKPSPPAPEDAVTLQPSASYSITMRVRLPQRPGSFGQVASAIGSTGGILGAIDLVRVERGTKLRDITVSCVDGAHGERVVDAVRALEGVSVERVSTGRSRCTRAARSRSRATVPVKTRDDLSMAYTPGVARVCTAIHEDPERAWSLTIKGNTVAVVSDGTAVLGLGDIGPEAAMPVMEGKALLFKEFAGVDAFPLCLATTDVDEIVAFVKAVAPDLRRHQPRGHLGAALLRDRAAAARGARHPRLPRRPARHGDRRARGAAERAARRRQARRGRARGRHGRRRGRHGVHRHPARRRASRDIVVCDVGGALYRGRARPRRRRARRSPSARTRDDAARHRRRAARGRRRASSACPGPGAVSRRRRSARWRPTRSSSRWRTRRPRCSPRRSRDDVAIMATGRSDYPNQINNVLAFPGVFRGALDVRASDDRRGDEARRRARRSPSVIADDELDAEYIIPSVFNRDVAPAVARAVAEAALASGVARRSEPPEC